MRNIILVAIAAVMLAGCAHMRLAPDSGECPEDFPVKGNVESGLFHIPQNHYYKVTKAEICFSSALHASHAGYRPPSRCYRDNCKIH